MRRRHPGLAVLALAAACVANGNTIAPFISGQSVVFVGGDGSPVIRVTLIMGINGAEGEAYLDGVSMVVNDGGDAYTFDAPALQTNGFPLGSSGQASIILEVPSPLGDTGTFEYYCSADARSVDVVAQVYIPQNDDDPDAPPPLVNVATTVPFPAVTPPPGSGIFPVLDYAQGGKMGYDVPRPADMVLRADDTVFFTYTPPQADKPATTSGPVWTEDVVFVAASPTIIRQEGGPPDLIEPPRLDAYGGQVFYAGRVSRSGAGLIGVGKVPLEPEYGWDGTLFAAAGADVGDAVAHASAISAHAGGLRVAVQSSAPLEGVAATRLSPAEGKYYGAFLFELDAAGTVLSATSSPRDIIEMVDLEDGSRIVTTGELPPREGPAKLRVERLDPGGTVLFTHEEPVLSYRATTTLLADGGVLLVTEDRAVEDTVVLVRLANDGSVVFRLRALGEGGSAAALANGSFMWAFTGGLAGLPKPATGTVPDRSVPVLVEVAADGSITRAQQLGCGGWSAVTLTASGAPIVLGSFDEALDLGIQVVPAERTAVHVATVQ
jgi:hypothetical protein